jgi:hypothetical protein
MEMTSNEAIASYIKVLHMHNSGSKFNGIHLVVSNHHPHSNKMSLAQQTSAMRSKNIRNKVKVKTDNSGTKQLMKENEHKNLTAYQQSKFTVTYSKTYPCHATGKSITKTSGQLTARTDMDIYPSNFKFNY